MAERLFPSFLKLIDNTRAGRGGEPLSKEQIQAMALRNETLIRDEFADVDASLDPKVRSAIEQGKNRGLDGKLRA